MLGIILLTTIGSLIFALIIYALGYYGEDRFIKKLYFKYKRCQRSIDKCKFLFKKYSKVSVLLGRMIPFSRIYISLIAGACKQDLVSYIFYSFFGIFIWNSILISLGFSFIINFNYIEEIYQNCKILILIIISVSIILIITWKNSSKKR